MKRQLRNKQFIIESLLENLQHCSHNNSVRSGNQILDKKRKENIDLISPDVDDPFKPITEITESIENSNEEFKTDKRTIDNKANRNNIVSTNIYSKSTE